MRLLLVILACFALPRAALAEGETAGQFDYWVMALSWSPSWCAVEGDARDSPQCAAERDHGWILHGLWPQYQRGWPSYCPTSRAAPSRGATAAMADIMGTSGLAWHQWKKHGTCSGLSAADYYALSRELYGRIARPEVFRTLEDPVKLPASVVEAAFLRDNPQLEPEMITITCGQGRIREARICISRDLRPIACAPDTRRDCTLEDALFAPIR